MRGRLENGDWVKSFDPQYPYYEYMYREANAWQSTFFAPHDTKGLIGLYGGEAGGRRGLGEGCLDRVQGTTFSTADRSCPC